MATHIPDVPAPAAPPPESDPVTQTLALLQPWIDYVPQRQRRLGLFIFLALLIHIVVFSFIRIDTARAELRRQPRLHVAVEGLQDTSLTGQSPGDDYWDRLSDPRLFLFPTAPPGSTASSDPSLDFINTSIESKQLPPAAPAQDYHFTGQALAPLDQRVGETMNPPRQPFTYQESPPPIAAKTTWVWDDTLARRQPSGIPELASPVSDTDLAPTQLNIAVSPDGTVQHAMVDLLEQNSGSGTDRLDLDQQAILAARKIRFQSATQPGVVWGRVTVFWHYSTKPTEDVVPTPTPSGP